jgi:hypothetical protein
VSPYSFIDPDSFYPLPKAFNYPEYVEIEREMWAFFPETEGKRVNFCQLGLTAKIFVESEHIGELTENETYFLMPCPDGTLRPIRMKELRRLTLEEFRMSHITAIRLADKLNGTTQVLEEIHMQILGPEILGGHA